MAERLDKLVAKGSGLSRKEAGKAIRAGRVLVEGGACLLPEAKVPADAALALDGAPLSVGNRYLMLNKPAGVLSATRDREGPTVLDLVPPPLRKNLFPAGRLDKDTEGFVLLTDDGDLAHRLLSPKSGVGKTYLARLDKRPDLERLAAAFAAPLELGKGEVTSPARLRLAEEGDTPLMELVICEGMYHQVKRMFGKFGLEVLHLERVAIGPVALDPALKRGEFRPLTGAELALLREESRRHRREPRA